MYVCMYICKYVCLCVSLETPGGRLAACLKSMRPIIILVQPLVPPARREVLVPEQATLSVRLAV